MHNDTEVAPTDLFFIYMVARLIHLSFKFNPCMKFCQESGTENEDENFYIRGCQYGREGTCINHADTSPINCESVLGIMLVYFASLCLWLSFTNNWDDSPRCRISFSPFSDHSQFQRDCFFKRIIISQQLRNSFVYNAFGVMGLELTCIHLLQYRFGH